LFVSLKPYLQQVAACQLSLGQNVDLLHSDEWGEGGQREMTATPCTSATSQRLGHVGLPKSPNPTPHHTHGWVQRPRAYIYPIGRFRDKSTAFSLPASSSLSRARSDLPSTSPTYVTHAISLSPPSGSANASVQLAKYEVDHSNVNC
jgi:hypothetical protein